MTLTAEEDSLYVSWRRRRLYMLLSKNRYIARLFSVTLGYDLAEKLYNLNNKLYIKSGVLLDIRLPSLYHVLVPSSHGSEGGSEQAKDEKCPPAESPHLQPHLQGPRKTPLGEPQAPQPWAPEAELPSGEDSTSLVLEDFADVAGSLMDYGSERDYLR